MSLTKFWICVLLATFFNVSAAFATESEDIVGRYWNPDRDGVIEIYKQSGTYQGRIIWSKSRMIDEGNPDASLRGRDMLGVPFLYGFRFNGENRWTGGRVYAPDDGRTYRGKIWLENGNLKMRGFVGISLFGRTATFVVYPKDQPLPNGGYRLRSR